MAIKTFTTGEVLTASDTNTYLNNYDAAAAVQLTSNLSVANGADTVITWSSSVYDNDTMFAAGTPNRLTIKTAGIYVVTATLTWAANSTNERISWIQKNNDASVRWGNRRGGAWTGQTEYSIAAQITCAVNDYIQIGVYQNSGGALVLNSAATSRTRMEVARISGL